MGNSKICMQSESKSFVHVCQRIKLMNYNSCTQELKFMSVCVRIRACAKKQGHFPMKDKIKSSNTHRGQAQRRNSAVADYS